jgi:hypothetical protein
MLDRIVDWRVLSVVFSRRVYSAQDEDRLHYGHCSRTILTVSK